MSKSSNNKQTKQKEIAGLLLGGATPADLVRQGHSRGWVYETARTLREQQTASESGSGANSGSDPAIENDPGEHSD